MMPSSRPPFLILLCLLCVWTSPLSANKVTAHARVRITDATLRMRLESGARRSPTLRRLVAELERSDLIVHVMPGQPEPAGRHGALAFVTSAGSHRFLRVTIDARLAPAMLVALLAHELQHAVEVSRAPWVVDQASFAELYDRIGTRSCTRQAHPCYETDAARLTTGRVLVEMRGELSSR